QEGLIVGSPSYLSPEQARGQAVDRRTDIWAFGCVLYEMLSGERAFKGNTLTDTLAAIVEREPAWDALPKAIPAPVLRWLRRCLEKNPAGRLHDVADAHLELDDALATPAESVGPMSAVHRKGRIARFAWIAGVIGVVALLVMGISYFKRPRDDGRVIRLSVLP